MSRRNVPVRSSGIVQCRILYPSAIPDLRTRIRRPKVMPSCLALKFVVMQHLRRNSLFYQTSLLSVVADRLLGLRVRIPPGAWMPFCFDCCVLPCRGLCERPIPRPEEFYRLCVCVWSRNLTNEAALAHVGLLRRWGGGDSGFRVHSWV